MSQPNSSSSKSAQDSLPVNPLHAIYADKQVGECFDFGRYPQGANGEVEPITWRVLQRNADRLLVIAEQGLDCKPYHKARGLFARLFVFACAWTDCSLRLWLNSEFYDKAFNKQERKCILKTSVVNNAGSNTEDCIFLLSVDEAERLFADDAARRAKPTKYAVKNGVYTKGADCCFWWLRSRGNRADHAAGVSIAGGVYSLGVLVNSDGLAVRPALKLAL